MQASDLLQLSERTVAVPQLHALPVMRSHLRDSYWLPSASQQRPALPILNKTNSQLAQKFGEWLVAMRFSRAIYQAYTKVAFLFCAFLADRPLQSASHMDVRLFLIEVMKQNVAVEGFNRHLYALRRFFDFLYLGGVVDSVVPDSSSVGTGKSFLRRCSVKSSSQQSFVQPGVCATEQSSSYFTPRAVAPVNL